MSRFLNRFTKTTLAAVTALTMGFADVHAEGNKNDSGNTDQSGKDETVYVITDASGSRQEVIVSDWLKNTNGSMKITDESLLKDIENVAGNESFTQNNDGTITWNAEGKDVYYQGTTDKELPVEVKISYKLDGEDITAEELAGKKGHVVIHFDYINNTEDTVTVNGKEETVKVPFAMITGVQINQDKFSDIKVTNGKVISEGKTSFVVGMAFPGLSTCLDTDSDLLEADIPEYVEIEADTTGFELGMTMTVAGNNLLKNLDLNTDGQVSELTDKMNQLIDASRQLEDGTKTLKDGTAELRNGAGQLLDGTNTLKDGTSQLKDGASALKDGAGKLDDGVSAVKDGAEKLNTGAQTLKAGADSASAGASDLSKGAATLAEGAKTLYEGIAHAQAGASKLKNGTANLKTGSESLYNGLSQEAEGLETLKNSVDKAVDNAPKTKEEAQSVVSDDTAAINQAKMNLINAVKALVKQKADEAYDKGFQAGKKDVAAKEAYGKRLQNGTKGELVDQYQQKITSLQKDVAAKDEEIANLKAEIEQLKNQPAPVQAAPAAATAPEAAPQETTPEITGSAPAAPVQAAPTVVEKTEVPQETASENSDGVPAETEEVPNEETQTEPTETVAAINADEAGNHIVMLGSEEPSKEELETAISEFADTVKTAAIHGTTAELIGSLRQMQEGINNLYAGMYGIPQQQPGILDGALSLQNGAARLDDGMAELVGVDENGNPVGGIAALKEGAYQLSAGANALAQGSAKLDNGNKALADGAKTLADGTSALSDGTKELSNGSNQLKDGAGDLADGAAKLDNGAGELHDGVVKLADGTVALDDGALELMEGMSQFETEGMEKLADVFGNKLTDMVDRLTALNDAGTSYKNFAGASGSENDSVKFIFKTESVKAE